MDYWHLIPVSPIQKQNARNAALLVREILLELQEYDEVVRIKPQSAHIRSIARKLE